MATEPTKQSGLSLVPDISKANFYNADEGDMANLQKAQEDALTALQQRYAQPNWFNVAAGFLKPQLGGFAASLGSASQAMGENLENQRASEMTAAQMRSQIALTKMAVTQKQKAASMAAALAQKPGGVTAQDVADITNTDQERGTIAQQLLKNEQDTRKEILELHAAGRTDAELKAIYGPKFDQLYPNGTANLPKVPGTAPITTTAQAAEPSLENPPLESGLTKEQWKLLPLQRKNQIVTEVAGTNQENINNAEKSLRAPAEIAQQQLPRLRGIRELATAPGMDVVFNVLGGSDLISLMGKGVSEGRLTDRLADLEELLTQSKITDPITRRKTAELVKLINEQKLASGDSNAATDEYRRMRSSSNPSLANPQDAFVNLTDAIAHDQRRRIDLWKIQQGDNPEKTRLNAYTFIASPLWNKYHEKFTEEHSRILNQPMRLDTPSDIYDMSPQTTSVEVRVPGAAAPAARAAAPAPSGSVRPAEAPAPAAPAKLGKNAIQAEIDRRAALKKP